MEISILSIATLSALGTERESASGYARRETALQEAEQGGRKVWVGSLPEGVFRRLKETLSESYGHLDPSVWYAIWTGRAAVQASGWGAGSGFGVNIGSSRGATGLFEKYYDEFRATGGVGTQASPSTTLGNIASWVAQDLRSEGPVLSHSITCSTALHSILNGAAWLRSGMARRFLAGGSEAPLTPFTIAQMRALRIYSRENGDYPCRALDLEKKNNTMVLGEGAGAVCLEAGQNKHALAYIVGMGWATEPLAHGASLSAKANCLQRSMQMAMDGISPKSIDVVVMHAPGTVKGDRSEFRAIQQVFGRDIPALTTNKWKIGHTLGASGLLSLEMAVMMLKNQEFIEVPYVSEMPAPSRLRYILVNAVGFGGNAVTILLRKP